MKNAKAYCTCTDIKCPCHPVNHDQGCDLCIQKNLRQKEIPSCFFNLVDSNYDGGSYTFEDFAALVAATKGEEE